MQIFDGNAIAEWLAEPDLFWIAEEYLKVPAELFPPLTRDDSYLQHKAEWKNRPVLPVSTSDFVAIKSGLRKATFEPDIRPDLGFWLGKMEGFLDSQVPRSIVRSAIYELAVAHLRGRNNLTSQSNRLTDYFGDLGDFPTIGDLSDATTLLTYSFGAFWLGSYRADELALHEWRGKIAAMLDAGLAAANGPGQRAAMLDVYGMLELTPRAPGEIPKLLDALTRWHLMLDEAEAARLFPLEPFSDYIIKIVGVRGSDGDLEKLADRVEDLLALRVGTAAAAKKTVERAMVLIEREDVAEGIRILHAAKAKWFSGEIIVDAHRLGPVRRNAGNPEIALSRNEVLTERTDIVGSAFLGLTIGCARCHNHKLEPISQKDYYRFQAYMAATEENNVNLAPEAEYRQWEAKTQELKKQIARLKKQMRAARDNERKRLAEEIQAIDDAMPPPPPTIPATRNELSRRTEIHVLRRGIWEDKGELVGPRPPSILVPETNTRTAGRRSRSAHATGAVAHVERASTDGAGAGQSDLGPALRPGTGENGERLRHPRRPSQPPGVARLAGGNLRGERLAAQTAPPADRAEQRLSPVESVADRGGCPADRPGEPTPLALQPAPADGRGNPRCHARCLRAAEPQARRAERHGAGRSRAREAAL